MYRRLIFALAAVLATVPALAADEIVIGASLPLSGPLAGFGNYQKWGYETAVADINKSGGVKIGGKAMKVKLVIRDDKTNPNTTAGNTEALISRDKATALLGSCTPALVKAGALVAERRKVPLVAGCDPLGAFKSVRQWKYAWVIFFDESDLATAPLEGPTNQVLSSDEVAAVYLGTKHSGRAAGLEPQVAVSPAPQALIGVGSGAPMLELRNVHAGYGQARVWEGVDLSIQRGQVVANLGINGAGKTTMAGVINGSIQPTAGDRLVDGRKVTDAAAYQIATLGVATCPEGRRIFESLSVEENLLLAARSVPAVERRTRLEEIYTLFPDLKARRLHAGTSMSGGQQQMLAIGRALMSRPRMVIFDEISLGLAPVVIDRLYGALRSLKDGGLAMLIVEQDVVRALALADYVHVLEHGRVALSGRAEAVRRDPRLRHLYIGAAN